jgi:hypothetical protein
MANRVRFVDNVGVSAFGSTAGNDALTNASASLNNIVFTKGDNSQFTITVDTGSGGGFFNTSSLMITASIAGNDLTFSKGDNSTFTVALPSGGGGGNGIFTKIGSTDQFQATSSLKISGSTLFETPLEYTASLTASDGAAKYALVVSESVWHRNANVGVPTTNAWKSGLDGSYFDRFDHNTDTSEILRFIAGLLKDQAPDSSPNTRTWNSVGTTYIGQSSTTSRDTLFPGVLGGSYEASRLSQHWTSSAFINFTKTGSYREAQEYFIAKGFMVSGDKGTFGNDTGTNPFSNSYGSNFPTSNLITSGEFSSLTFNVASSATGDTSVTSSNNVELFGMGELNSGNAREIFVQVKASQSYSDNASNATPDASTNNFTTSSVVDYNTSTFGLNADGLRLGKIVPSNPSISPAFQDGLFTGVDGPITGRFYTSGATDNNSISSSGYYRMHGVSIGLKTGSMSSFEYKNGNDSSTSIKFYMPSPTNGSYTSQGGIEDITSGIPATIVSDTLTRTAFSATSRSLSGAPYLLTTTYNFTYNAHVTKSFDAAYSPSVDPITIDLTDLDTWENIGSTTPSSPLTVDISSNGINTSTANAGVFPFGGGPSDRRSTSVIPHINDIAYISSSLSFALDSNANNITSATWTTSTNYNLRFSTTGRNWKQTSNTSSPTATQLLYDATLFGQPSASGSMAVYSFAQGYDAGQETSTSGGVLSEQFSGEDFRVKINSNALNGTYAAADKFTTDSYVVNNLLETDLQVRPGYLVSPGGTYGYWLPTIGSSTYKYYARAFNATGFSGLPAKSFTINIGKQFQNLKRWYEDVNETGISIGILFQSGLNTGTSRRVLIDLLDYNNINGSFDNITPQAGLNPFGTAIDIFTNNTTTPPSNTETDLPLTTNLTKFTVINSTTPSFIICIRYNNVSNDYIDGITMQLSSS